MGISAFGLSDVGKVRKNNEDSIYLNDQLHLYMIADGMGGHLAGEVASSMALETTANYIQKNLSHQSSQVLLVDAHIEANRAIFHAAHNNQQNQGMGTTIVTLFFKESYLYISNVGDSRAYLIHHGEIYQLTKDHTLTQEKIHLGLITREDAKNDPLKNVLVRTIGYEPQVEIDSYNYRVCRNDLFLICSDGLHSCVSNSEIINIINENYLHTENDTSSSSSFNSSTETTQLLQKTTQKLIEFAYSKGAPDNISIILIATS